MKNYFIKEQNTLWRSDRTKEKGLAVRVVNCGKVNIRGKPEVDKG